MSDMKASRASQLCGEICEAEDTEEMFWLRQNEDAQSKIKLGTLLAGQYRFREAEKAFGEALHINPKDPSVWLRLGGARLTLLDLDGAREAYENAQKCGAGERSLGYPLGIWHYLRGEYGESVRRFESCRPCDGEMEIALLYWIDLCRMRSDKLPFPPEKRKEIADFGHHAAYARSVALFDGTLTAEELEAELDGYNDLDRVIAGYALYRFLDYCGKNKCGKSVLEEILKTESVWPCVSGLAAWNDFCKEEKNDG